MSNHQYASFGIWSRRMPAHEMTARLGIDPDEISVRGADLVDPPVPSAHEWKVTCRDAAKSIDEQVAMLVERLSPFVDSIGALAEQLSTDHTGGARLLVVRDLKAETSGWRLNQHVVRFLQATNAEVGVDE